MIFKSFLKKGHSECVLKENKTSGAKTGVSVVKVTGLAESLSPKVAQMYTQAFAQHKNVANRS